MVARQAPLSMGFSRQEGWSRLPFPSPEDLPDPETEPVSPTLQVDSLLTEPPGKPPITIPFLGMYTKRIESKNLNRYLYTSVHSSTFSPPKATIAKCPLTNE